MNYRQKLRRNRLAKQIGAMKRRKTASSPQLLDNTAIAPHLLERLLWRHYEDILIALHLAAEYEESYADAWKDADKNISMKAALRAKHYRKIRQKLCGVSV